MKLFDSHLHFFSRDFFEALARPIAERTGERIEDLLQRVAARAGIELPPADPVEHLRRWLGELDRHGVDKAVLFASLPDEAEAVRCACSDAEDRLIPFVMVNPEAQGAAPFVRHALQEMGFRGVLLFPSLHHYDLCGEATLLVLEEVRAAQGVALVHCGVLEIKLRDLLGHPKVYDLRFSNPLGLIPIANRFPEVPFIIPHLGAGFFREALIAGSQCRNLHVDTSSSNSWIGTDPADLTLPAVLRKALEIFGPERILFGTDSTTFPRGWRSDIYRTQSGCLEKLGISIADRNLIFGENLARILSIKP